MEVTNILKKGFTSKDNEGIIVINKTLKIDTNRRTYQ